jgi:hypothetical protein
MPAWRRVDVEVFENDDKAASLAVSDHRPIWATFDMDGPDDDGLRAATAVVPVGWGMVKRGR